MRTEHAGAGAHVGAAQDVTEGPTFAPALPPPFAVMAQEQSNVSMELCWVQIPVTGVPEA